MSESSALLSSSGSSRGVIRMERDNASTATQAKSGLTRRGVMRKTAIGAGTAVGIGASASRLDAGPVGSAKAIAPLALAGGVAAGGAAYYALREVGNPLDWIGESNEDYEDADADATHAQIRENALSLKQADEAVIGNMQNLLNASENHVIAQAKKAGIDAMNTGKSESEVVDDATAEATEFFKTQQINLASHFDAQNDRIQDWHIQVDETSGLSLTDVFAIPGSDESPEVFDTFDTSVTLVNGSEFSVTDMVHPTNSGDASLRTWVYTVYDVSPVDSGEDISFFDNSRYTAIWDEIEDKHSDVSSEITTWVEGVYPAYEEGDVSTSDMISANDLIGDSFEQGGETWAGASLASMGLRGSSFGMSIELLDMGRTVEGTIYHQDESIDTLEVGVEYAPGDIAGTVYIAYEDGDGSSDLDEVNQAFIIREIRDSDGNERDEADYDNKNQQTYDQEIEQIQEELDRVTELRLELEAERDAVATSPGGAGGFLDGDASDIRTLGIVAGGAALAALLFGQN